MMTDEEKYWTERYMARETGWDMGQVSPPIASYADQLTDRSKRILIPGAGNGWEAEYLWNSGFSHVHILDISIEPLRNFERRLPSFPRENIIHADFFAHEGRYDLVLEQTFFCALDPDLRGYYAKKVSEILVPGGKLAGVLFTVPLNDTHPPYGGSAEDYLELFEKHFSVVRMTPCYNSIPPRMGSEHFIWMVK